jgi:crotonobetainyl-CoA:carnitine CoA-transferase CaiB-like acyl-CoA transferase
LAALGFSPEACADARPGIIAATLSTYGHHGPWASRRGFDSLVQTASGFNYAEAEAAGISEPKELPAQVLDHASGYLMAFGIMTALKRKALEGGSWHVRVSLAQTGYWLSQLGRAARGLECTDPGFEDVEDLLDTVATPSGPLTFVRHAAMLSETPANWTRAPAQLGTHAPVWPV